MHQKTRINDLARELEVKSNVILDLLPVLGVTEKKTHSSSVEDDVAEKIRIQLRNGGGVPVAHEAAPHLESPPPAAATVPSPVAPTAVVDASKPAALGGIHPTHPLKPPLRRPSLTPPMAAAAPAVSITPPPVVEALAPAPSKIAEPVSPPRPPASPVRPISSLPPSGQLATGPRSPLPTGVAPPASGHAPRPGSPTLRPQLQPGQRLAGQPPVRPVVPARPDVAAKLQQQTGRPVAAGGAAPGLRKPLPPPTPGQPIFQRPGRPAPGSPPLNLPGQPQRPSYPSARGPAGPGLRPGPRPMHPTSRMPRVGAAGAGVGLPPPGPLGPAPSRRPHKTAYQRSRDREAEQEARMQRRTGHPAARGSEEAPPISREIVVSEGITVKELSEKLGIKANALMKKLVDKGVFATINQALDAQTVTDLSRSFGASISQVSYEHEAMQEVQQAEEVTDLQLRAPVVTIMGHVDHGKTSLLDAIRETNVAGREAGGITQAIGAYKVEHKGREIVFIDTPGHQAFTRMRARGAKVTDLVILVVAADDGVMPQTLEAIDHAKAAKAPILVAINKTDKPEAQPERVKQQLSDRGLLAEDWGGETVMVPVSARAKTNLDLLLEMVLLVSDLQDLKCNPARPAMGTVLEAKLDRGQGPVATVLVQNGTLRVSDFFIVGSVFGKVRALLNDRGEPIREAGPSTPVVVMGLEELPAPGDSFQVVTDTAKAKQIVGYREGKARESAMAKSARMTLEHLHEQMRSGDVKELSIIVKADVGGSVEVLTDTLEKLSNDRVKMRIISSGVGAISESDVLLATTADAIIIGFNVRPERNAAALAEREGVDIRLHTIIYEVTAEIKAAMTGLLEPVIKEVAVGKAEVRDTFRIPKVGAVAGCFVQEGHLSRNSEVRLLRDNVVVYTGKIASLRRFKDDVNEVKTGFECGVTLQNYADVKQGDVIEAFATERVAAEALA